MRKLVRFGRRQAKRLIGLSSRQAAGLAVIGLLCLGVAAAALAGQAAIATVLLALLMAAVLAGVVHLSGKMAGLHRADQASIRDLRLVVDQLQRRVVGAVEKERLAAGDRHQELLETIARTERLTPAAAETLLRGQSHEIESLLQVFQQVKPRAPMPVADTVTPTDVLSLMHLVRSRTPKLTVLLGAGPSAVWLGYALEKGGRLVVVEHDAERAEQTRTLLRSHNLKAVEVLHAPLTDLSVEGRTVDWYDVDALDTLADIDMLVVDGPGTEGTAPAMHVLGRRLADGAEVVVADPTRPVPRQYGRWTELLRSREMTPVA